MHKYKSKTIHSIILTTCYKRGVEHNFGHASLFQLGNLNIYVYNKGKDIYL